MDLSKNAYLSNVKKRTLFLSLVSSLFIPGFAFSNDLARDDNAPRVNIEARSPWSGSVGLAFRKFSGGTFVSGSSASEYAIQPDIGSYLIETMDAGDETSHMLRNYDNGFVGPDTLGTTAGSFFEGTTSRFGYDSNAQIQGSSLLFQAPVSGTRVSSSISYQGEHLLHANSPDYETGIQLNLNYALPRKSEKVQLSMDFGLLYSPYDLQSIASNYSATRIDTTEELIGTLTDAYTIAAGVTLADAPYSQPDSNPAPGVLPRINDLPIRTVDTVIASSSESVTVWSNLLNQQYEAKVYSFHAGPMLAIDLGEHFSLNASGGASFHLTSWDAYLQEDFYQQVDNGTASMIASWDFDDGGTDVLLGAYLQGAVSYQFGEHKEYSIQGFARWDWAESQDDTFGTSQLDISYDSFSAGISLGMLF